MSDMAWLDESYKLPSTTSNYLKLKDKPQTIRILGSPTIGFLDRDKKGEKPRPVRSKTKQPPIGEDYPKEVWIMQVFNHDLQCVQIRECQQRTIKEALIALKDGSRGNPTEYDIEVSKKGVALETTYSVQPASSGKVGLSDKAMEIINSTTCDPEQLWIGGDPFETKF